MMPIEVRHYVSTSSGIPIVYNVTSLFMFDLKSSVKTHVPTMIDIPRLLLSNKELSLTASYKKK